MAKLRSLEKYGKLESGLFLYRRGKDGLWETPYKVFKLYVPSGSGVEEVNEAFLEAIGPGSRAVQKNEDGTIVNLSLNRTNLKEFFVRPDSLFEIVKDAEDSSVE